MKKILTALACFVTLNGFTQNIGIGTAYPDKGKLVVKSPNGVTAVLIGDSAAGLSLSYTQREAYIDFNAAVLADNTYKRLSNGHASYLSYDAGLGILRYYTAGTGTIGSTPTTGTVRLSIDAAGRVGIGTGNPLAKLDVRGHVSFNDSLLFFRSGVAGTNSIGYAPDLNGVRLRSHASGALGSFNGDALRWLADGRIGIGTANPVSLLANLDNGTMGSDGHQGNALSLSWASEQEGYAQTLRNSMNFAGANGLAVKIANATANSRLLDLSVGLQPHIADAPVMVVRGDGYVGIGQGNPVSRLSNTAANMPGTDGIGINGHSLTWATTAQGYVQALYNGATGYGANGLAIKIADATADVRLLDLSTGTQQAVTGTPVLVVRGDGNVGIGNNTPSQRLSVTGNIVATGTITGSSDIRFKKDLLPLKGALVSVLQLNPVYYHWRREAFPGMQFGDQRQLGFSAQEVERLFPELVLTDADGYKSVDYSRMTPVLVQAVKEQQQQLDEQRRKLEQLTKLVLELERKLVQKENQ